jgi:5-dehydro-2-deoxygluconokinase
VPGVDDILDVVPMGRCGVDLYPLPTGVGLEDVQTFGKYLSGSAANVAVAAARLGRHVALASGVGGDAFGRFARRALRELGVPLYFYGCPAADLQVRSDDLDLAAVRDAGLFWATVTGLSEEPSRSAQHTACEARGRRRHTVLDLDYRPMSWSSREAATDQVRTALPFVTVAVGNREECQVATGETDPERAADALLDACVELAVVKQVNGLSARDAFGGSLCHGLFAAFPLERVLHNANASGAIGASWLECSTAMPTGAEIDALVTRQASPTVDGSAPRLEDTRG